MTIHENGYFYTDIKATAEQEASMQQAYKVPYMIIGSYLPSPPEETVHACALANGLPEIVGFYGYDFSAHEFIRLPDADKGVPDKWPSRKLSDVLAAAGLG